MQSTGDAIFQSTGDSILKSIDASNEDVHQLLQPIQSVALDLNKLSTMVLVEL